MRFETCHRLKILGEFWSNPSEEMLSNTNAEPTTDFLDKICSTVPTEENGVEERPQFVPVSFVATKILWLSSITMALNFRTLSRNYAVLIFAFWTSKTLIRIESLLNM